MELEPTGDCFTDALEFIESHLWKELGNGKPREQVTKETDERYRLAHGIAYFRNGPWEGEAFSHAWVEEGERVWQAGRTSNGIRLFFPTDKAEFYRDLRVEDVTLYGLADVLVLNQKSETYGPWEDRYIALCRDDPRRRREGLTG